MKTCSTCRYWSGGRCWLVRPLAGAIPSREGFVIKKVDPDRFWPPVQPNQGCKAHNERSSHEYQPR